ncbi:MAG TPA: GNAT family N-acetyltransferase [Nannocystis sp.]
MSAPPDPEDRLRAGLAAPLFTADEWGAHLRVHTPFRLPDGDPLVLFLLRHSDPPLLGDLGETLRWLRSHTIEPRRSARQYQQIADACASLGVTLERGELRTTTRPDESLAAAAVRVAQACLRVADLRRAGRPRITRSFPDEVESYLRATLPGPLAITRNDRIPGISATTWSVDFRVRTPERHLLLFLLANERRDQARKLAEHVVAACTDLAHLRKLRRMPVQFITVFDDRGAAWNDGDARLVAPFATPHRWSERATWVPALADPELGPDLEDPDDDDNEDEPEEHSDDEATDPREDPPMTLHLRPATPDDYPEFARLFPQLGTSDPVPDEDVWTGHLHASTLMLVEGAQLLGYAYYERMEEFGYVRNVVIDAAHRGRGHGRTLMLRLAAHLRALGCTRWCLNVEAANTVAIALYRSLGLDVAYRSAALRFLWSAVESLPGEDLALEVVPVDPSEDAEIEAAHELPSGQLATIREDPTRILRRLHDPADPTALALGIASFNPHFPGAYPFRVVRPGLARALLLGLRPHALPDEPRMHVVVEDDEPLRALLLEIGAVLRLQLLFLRGDLP